ncbi:DUF881 domain-containing protein [Gottschalkiaceae bacterium SANA]|nr:DUF881 domain-containing protein [Gottschalkiaceae bacterium SANA]
MNDKRKLTLFIASLVLGFCLLWLARVQSSRLQEADKSELIRLENQIEILSEQIQTREDSLIERAQILETYQSLTDEIETLAYLREDLKEKRILSGSQAVKGPGILIKVNDRSNDGEQVEMFDLVHNTDILNIVNDLRAAGAEAISIEGERVTWGSKIQCGGPIIWVNDESTTAPFVMKVIGDPSVLFAAVTAPNTYTDLLRSVYNLEVRVLVSENLEILGYERRR